MPMLVAALAFCACARNARSDEGRTAYDRWVARFSSKSPEGAVLVVTVVDPAKNDDFVSTSTWTVSADGKLSWMSHNALGARGGSGSALPAAELERVKALGKSLPADAGELPPPERRVLVQASGVARVYDRGQLPEIVMELLRVSGCRIGAWFPTFTPNGKIDAAPYEHGGFLALSPDGKRILFATSDRLQFWAPPTHETLGDLHLHGGNSEIAFSRDGALAAISGHACEIFDTHTWKVVRTLSEPPRESSSPMLYDPHFTPDRRYLAIRAGSDTLRFFDTTTWRRVETIPEIPPEAVQWRPAGSWRHAVMRTRGGAVSLWDAQTHTASALDPESPLLDAAFSPDESQFVIATADKDGYSHPRLRLFDTATGKLVHELRYGEMGCDRLRSTQWTPDGRYVLAVIRPGSFFTSESVSVFGAKTGRHRGDFVDCPSIINGVAVLPDGETLVAGCEDGKIRFWDFAGAMRAIDAFEKSVDLPTAVK
jgi:hypothetical protein